MWKRILQKQKRSSQPEESMADTEIQSARASVLFVCMGNICRSPTAEGVFRHHVNEANLNDEIYIDSAGTHAYHVGEPPDRRAAAAAGRRGISLDGIQARRVADEDFERFDYIIAMDELNQVTLIDRAPEEYHNKIRLFLSYTDGDENRGAGSLLRRSGRFRTCTGPSRGRVPSVARDAG